MTSSQHNKKGFTLLFAALVGSLVIAVGLAILNITLQQLTLASAGRESQQAFFSADAGTECALYLDRGAGYADCRLGFFGTPSTTASSGISVCGVNSTSAPHINSTNDIQCFGRQISITRTPHPSQADPSSVENDFSLVDPGSAGVSSGGINNSDGDMCFNVVVLKTKDTDTSKASTIIESRGYNTCNVNTLNRFERAIRTVNQ